MFSAPRATNKETQKEGGQKKERQSFSSLSLLGSFLRPDYLILGSEAFFASRYYPSYRIRSAFALLSIEQ